ncbi:MAG: MATE family efflux transporter [Gammaproteobacteria bacterium]
MTDSGNPDVRRKFWQEAKALAILAGPLVANNLAIAGMNVTDTVMAGRLGATNLAAVAVGSSIWMVAFLFGLGVMMAMSPTAAHFYGAGEHGRIGGYTRQCLWLSQGLAWILVLLLHHAGALLTAIGIDSEIIPLTSGYVYAISWGMPFGLAYLALRFTSEGVGWTRPIMYIALIALVVNALGNYVLMFGKLGLPALGAVGCGWASAITTAIMLLFMATYIAVHKRYKPFRIFDRFELPHLGKLRELAALGLPIGVSVISEAGMFSAVALLMGTLGAVVVAAHQVAINYAATMFMIPLAMHSAMTIRVGQTVGRGKPRDARYMGLVGITLCGLIMAASAAIMLIFREAIVGFYTTDTAVRDIAVSLLVMAAVFQISDGIQVGGAGALRGFKDTKIPMLLNFAGYWLLGFPLAYYLGVVLEQGPKSVWFGLVASLTVTAVLLNGRFLVVSRRAIRAAGGPGGH